MKKLLLTILLLIPCIAEAGVDKPLIVTTAYYKQKYNAVEGLEEPTFVICDCLLSPSLALLKKEIPEQIKRSALLSAISVKASETPIQEPPLPFLLSVGTVFFDFNSSSLRKETVLKLDEIAETIKTDGIFDIIVSGYTCDIGTKEYNDRLAQRRASTVTSYLESKGIDVKAVRGEGECCYVSSIKKENRRVEVMGYQNKPLKEETRDAKE